MRGAERTRDRALTQWQKRSASVRTPSRDQNSRHECRDPTPRSNMKQGTQTRDFKRRNLPHLRRLSLAKQRGPFTELLLNVAVTLIVVLLSAPNYTGRISAGLAVPHVQCDYKQKLTANNKSLATEFVFVMRIMTMQSGQELCSHKYNWFLMSHMESAIFLLFV